MEDIIFDIDEHLIPSVFCLGSHHLRLSQSRFEGGSRFLLESPIRRERNSRIAQKERFALSGSEAEMIFRVSGN